MKIKGDKIGIAWSRWRGDVVTQLHLPNTPAQSPTSSQRSPTCNFSVASRGFATCNLYYSLCIVKGLKVHGSVNHWVPFCCAGETSVTNIIGLVLVYEHYRIRIFVLPPFLVSFMIDIIQYIFFLGLKSHLPPPCPHLPTLPTHKILT